MMSRSLLGLNPELQRLLWLEFSPLRLIVMPLVIVVVLGGFYMADNAQRVVPVANIAVTILVILWGTRLAVESVSEELSQRTWDVQRLAAVNPWGLAIGKLLGSASYAWYGVLFLVVASQLIDSSQPISRLIEAAASGLVAQAAALFAILALYRAGRRGRSSAALAQLFGVIWGLGLGVPGFFDRVVAHGALSALAAGPQGGHAYWYTWYGLTMPGHWYRLIVFGTFGVWFVVGTAMIIRREMGERHGPLMWTSFLVYGCLMIAGSDPADWQLEILLPGQVAAVAAAATYITLCITPFTMTDFKRIQIAARDRRWWMIWQELPAWLPSAVIAVVAACVLMIFSVIYTMQVNFPNISGIFGTVGLVPGAIFGYIGNFVRDLLLVSAIRLRFERRTDLLLVVSFGLLYLFFPYLLAKTHEADWQQVFTPLPNLSSQGMFGPWVLAAAALALFVWVWKSHAGRRPTSG